MVRRASQQVFVCLRVDLGDPGGGEGPQGVLGGVFGGDPGVDLGAPNGSWSVPEMFPGTLGCTRVDLGSLEGVGGFQRVFVGILRVEFYFLGWIGGGGRGGQSGEVWRVSVGVWGSLEGGRVFPG